jgi:hypothetical protein
MTERREAKIRDREEKNRLKKEKIALEAKKLEIDVVEKERVYKLQEQNMKMQAVYFQFFKEQFSRRESDGNNNRGSSNETPPMPPGDWTCCSCAPFLYLLWPVLSSGPVSVSWGTCCQCKLVINFVKNVFYVLYQLDYSILSIC